MIIDIAILCPVEVEFKIIRNILENPISRFIEQGNLSFELGQITGQDYILNIAIIETAISSKSFEIKTHEVLQILKPKYIFLAGIAGGIKDVQIGDLLIGTKAYDYEPGKETEEGFAARPAAMVNDSEQLLVLAKNIARDIEKEQHPFKMFFGPIASGKKVLAYTDSETYRIIKKHYNDSLGIEKEAFAFAAVARQSGTRYLNIRCISDMLDGKAKSDAEGHQEKASEKVALFLKRLIPHLPIRKQASLFAPKIYFTKDKFSSSIFRKNIRVGFLQFNKDYINLISGKKNKVIRNILELEYLKMPGDFSKNWVRVKYAYNNTEDEIYFSDSLPLGVGAWIGGSKKLLQYFTQHQKKQIQL